MAKSPFSLFEPPDVTKLMSEFKVPGVDLESLMATQRKNIEALTRANQLAVESIQTVARRQAELVRAGFEDAGAAMRGLMTGGNPAESLAKQSELAKRALEESLANAREVAEIFSKAANEAFEVLNRRVGESIEEVRGMVQPRK